MVSIVPDGFGGESLTGSDTLSLKAREFRLGCAAETVGNAVETHPVATGGGAWACSLLQSAHEPFGVGEFSILSRLALASRTVAAEPKRPLPLGSHAAPHHSLAAFACCLSSLSSAAHGRCHLSDSLGTFPVRGIVCG